MPFKDLGKIELPNDAVWKPLKTYPTQAWPALLVKDMKGNIIGGIRIGARAFGTCTGQAWTMGPAWHDGISVTGWTIDDHCRICNREGQRAFTLERVAPDFEAEIRRVQEPDAGALKERAAIVAWLWSTPAADRLAAATEIEQGLHLVPHRPRCLCGADWVVTLPNGACRCWACFLGEIGDYKDEGARARCKLREPEVADPDPQDEHG